MGNVMRVVSTNKKIDNENHDILKDEDVVVIQDYPSADFSEPIYRIGEKLQVIAKEEYWWRVRSLRSEKENNIPKSHVAKVYHSWLFEGVGRQKAEELLLLPGNRMGSFLVRESSTERGLYSLSVKHRTIKHYRIFRLDNSWYYISPCLTFQCLEDMINHYCDSGEGLCCTLTTPCLSGILEPSNPSPQTPPVVMRRNFDWNRVNKKQLVSTDSHDDNMVSYGVRNSIAAYLSFSGQENPSRSQSERRKKKSKSLYVTPETNIANLDYEDDF